MIRPAYLEKITSELAESVVSAWTAFASSPQRAVYKSAIQRAFSRVIVDHLIEATKKAQENQ